MHGCDVAMFTRRGIKRFCRELCQLIDMERCDLHFWDDVGLPPEECQTEPHAKGTSAVQFILTSSVVIHTLDLTGKVFINVFSCKRFDAAKTEAFCVEFFRADSVGTRLVLERD